MKSDTLTPHTLTPGTLTPRTLTLIRHAPTHAPKDRLPPPDSTIDLSDDARIQHCTDLIPKNATWWISPLSRCQETAQALIDAGAKPQDYHTHDRLYEQDFGDWHNMPIADIWAQLKDVPKTNWGFIHPKTTPPEGESFLDVLKRLAPVLDDIKSHLEKENLVLICHAMVIRALLGLTMGLGAAQALAFEIAPLSATQLTYIPPKSPPIEGGDWMLNYLNR